METQELVDWEPILREIVERLREKVKDQEDYLQSEEQKSENEEEARREIQIKLEKFKNHLVSKEVQGLRNKFLPRSLEGQPDIEVARINHQIEIWKNYILSSLDIEKEPSPEQKLIEEAEAKAQEERKTTFIRRVDQEMDYIQSPTSAFVSTIGCTASRAAPESLEILSAISANSAASFAKKIGIQFGSKLGIAVAALIVVAEIGWHSSDFYQGKITKKQLAKKAVSSIIGGAVGYGGYIGTVALTTAVIAVGCIPAVVIGIVGGVIAGGGSRHLMEKLLDKFFPDTEEELEEIEENVRKMKYKELYKNALKQLGCSEASSDEEIKKARDRLAKAHHPDRWPIDKHGKEKCEKEGQEFIKYWTHWTIINDYREAERKQKPIPQLPPPLALMN